MDIRGMHMNEDVTLTELEESLIVCNTILSKTDSLIRALKDWDVKENDFVYIALIEALILEVNKYMEEYTRHLAPILRREKKEWIIEIHSPMFDCLEKSRTRIFRNMHIAHPHRDRKGDFVFLEDTVQNAGIAIGRYDVIFLGECTKWLIVLTGARLKNDLESAMRKLERMKESGRFDEFLRYVSEMNSYEDVMKRVKDVMKECDRIFYSKFPDEKAWIKKTQLDGQD